MSILNWSATPADNDDADLANGIDWREGQLAATVNNSSRATMAALFKFVRDISGDLTTTGSGAAYVLTTAQTITSLAEPLMLAFKASFTSNAAATLNVDGLGPIAILRKDGTATESGDIVSTGAYLVVYSGALSKFIGLNIAGGTGQPLDADLTEIAALTTTAAGRSVLTIADPGADRVIAWDDSAGAMAAIALADVTAEGSPTTGDFFLMYGAEGDLRKVDFDDMPGAAGGISNVVEDTSPSLGGPLDADGFDIIDGGVITLREQAAAEADVAGAGQIWVKTATPNELWFTDDAGTDFSLLVDADIGVTVQAWDAQLDSLSAASANGVSLVTAADYAAMATLLEPSIEGAIDTLANLVSVQGLTVTLADAGADAIFGWDDSASAYQNLSAADVRTALALVIGTNVQAWDAQLDSLSSASANGVSLITAADYAAMRTLLDLEAGTDFYSKAAADAAFQPLDADLTAVAALTTTAAGRSVLTIADAGADRVVAWDDSAGAMAAIALADITDEGSPAAGDFLLLYGAEGDLRRVDWDDLPGAGGGIAEVAEDTSPSLGGPLDADGFDINDGGVIFLREQAAAEADVAGQGQFWVLTATPNVPMFTDDAGTDLTLAYAGGAFHDGFSDFVANEHIDHSGVTLTAGNGLTGGGTIAANRTFAVGAGTGIAVNADDVALSAGSIASLALADSSLQKGKHTIQFLPGSFMEPASGAPEYLKVSATNQLPAFGFDTSADESLWFAFRAPKSSDETAGFTFDFVWSHAATVTNFGVAMFLELVAVANSDLISTAMGTAVELDDTGGTTDDIFISDESGTVTPGNTWAEGDLIIGRLYRDVSDAADNLGVDMRLHAMNIYVTLNAGNDA